MWVVRFTITTFHLHAFFFTCLCLPTFHFFSGFKTPARTDLNMYCIRPVGCFLHKLTNLPARVVFTPSPNPVKTFTSTTCSALEPLVSDSPVLCWAGCWATVSLLALCPMLWLLSLLACRALPLSGPAAGEENLKPPHSSPSRHGSSCNSSLSSLLTCVV